MIIFCPELRLRPVECSDAEFILSLRTDESLNKHLSAVSNDVDQQRQWIVAYKEREKTGKEFYFLIESPDHESLGTTRVYDLQPDSFSWGSWLLKKGLPPSIAIRSAMLVYDFGFERLGFPSTHFEVRKGNTSVITFHERFGAKIVNEDDKQYFFKLQKSEYYECLTTYRRFVPKKVEYAE